MLWLQHRYESFAKLMKALKKNKNEALKQKTSKVSIEINVINNRWMN